MFKKILSLLIFSVSLFTSAQTMTVVELTSTGSTTFGQSALHVIQGDDLTPYVYNGYTTNVISYTLADGLLTTPDGEYATVGSFENISRNFIYRLGLTGKFFNAETNEQLEDLELSLYHRDPLFAAFDANDDWVLYPQATANYERVVCNYVYRVAELGPNRGHNQFLLTREIPGDPTSWEIIIARNFDFVNHPGTYFRYAEDVIAAVDQLAIDAGCTTCVGTDTSYEELNALISALGFEAAGFTAWNNRVGSANRWDRIEIDGDQFVLETDTGSEGRVGVRTSYDCLEDLIAALQ